MISTLMRGVVLTLALAGVGSAVAAGPSLQRRVVFVGGPTLAHWAEVWPSLFKVPGATLLIAPDGTTAGMLKLAQQRLPQDGFEAVEIEPEPGLPGDTLQSAESHIQSILTLAGSAHVVLSAPLALAGSKPYPDEAALEGWMTSTALAKGYVFEGFGSAYTGGLPPMRSYADLLPRDAPLRQALDASFMVKPGEGQMDVQKRIAAESNAMPDSIGSGPYPAVRDIDPALPTHTFYRPANLAPFQDHGLPVLIWGNGGCANDSGGARQFLEDVASYGYLVIAPASMKSGPGASPRRIDAPDSPPKGQLGTGPADMTAALDFVTTSPAGAPWRRFITPGAVAVSGHSCGGLQATKLAEDKRIKATMIFSSGTFVSGAVPIPGLTIGKDDLKLLHTPMLYVLGGSTDVAFPNGSDDYAKLPESLPAMLMVREVGHGGTFRQSNGGIYAKVAEAWLNWQLRGDAKNKAMFVGAKCGFCDDANWTISRKNGY